MADTWLTIEQAAVALGLSVRTVNRHIVAEKIQSRLNDGRREVLVDMPNEASAGASDAPHDDAPFAGHRVTIDSQGADFARQASDHARAATDQVRQVSESTAHTPAFDPNTVLALADNAAEKAELAISAYQTLAHSTHVQFQNVRRSARIAWSSVAVMAVGVAIAVGWTTHYLTKAQVEGAHLQQQVRQTTDKIEATTAEREALRSQLAAAREYAARAEGQVTALSDAQARAEARTAVARTEAPPPPSPSATQPAELSDARPNPPAAQPTTRPLSFKDVLTFLGRDKAD